MGSPDDLPVDGHLVFFLKSDVPADFPRDEKVEVAAADASFHTMLALSDGGLMLEDAHTAEASLDPLARFGSSAFGPVRVRAISADGATGDWVPWERWCAFLDSRSCAARASTVKPCMLSGTDLFLATSFSATPTFDNSVNVPPEFTGTQLVVPHPVKGVLYLKLRDDPASQETLTLPVMQMTPAELEAPTVQTAAPKQNYASLVRKLSALAEAHANARVDAEGIHIAEGELGPVLIFEIGSADRDSGCPIEVQTAAGSDDEVAATGVVVREIEVAEPDRPLA